jgi:hypothetical protein
MADPHKVAPLQKGPKGWKAKLNAWAKDLEWCIAEIKKLRRRRADGPDEFKTELCVLDEDGNPTGETIRVILYGRRRE